MEHIKDKLDKLAKQLNLIDPNQDPEPYILTKEEEDRIIEFELKSAKDYVKWKMEQLKALPEQIEQRISEIDWDAKVNKDEILLRANSIKNHEVWLKEKHKKDKEEEERLATELKNHWTAKRMYNLMAWTSQNVFSKKLIVNNDNRHLITALCFFISRDDRFFTELKSGNGKPYDPLKGLLIRGISGIGKTHLVRCVEENLLNPILTLSMIEISDELKAYGEYEIKKGNKKIIYLDDVGTEETPIVHFGTKIHFFKNFIETVYHNNKEKCFNNLILSTNLNFAQCSDKYGFRVASRMRDMFNVIDVSGKDMRG